MALSPAGGAITDRQASFAVVLTLITAALICALTGCSSSASGSRANLYESIDDLAGDSTAIVIGTVTSQRQDDDAIISTFEVSNAPTNPQLGANVEGADSLLVAGDTVEVRQMDSGAASSAAAPLLESDQEYLLFLTPSMLAGDAATQFYVTGAEAGLYIRDGDEFRRVMTDTGDILPETISITGDDREQ